MLWTSATSGYTATMELFTNTQWMISQGREPAPLPWSRKDKRNNSSARLENKTSGAKGSQPTQLLVYLNSERVYLWELAFA